MLKHQILKTYLEGLTRNLYHSVVCIGDAGTGKTEITLTYLKELGYKENEHYLYTTNFVTPLELYLTLEKVNALKSPRILLLDDAEMTLVDKKAVGVLRSALWETPNGKRKVCWASTTPKVKDKELDFTGKIVFLLNKFDVRNELLRALKDRTIFYNIKLTSQEIANLMLERAKRSYDTIPLVKRLEIARFVATRGIHSPSFSLRMLPKAFQLYILSPSNWQQLFLETIK